MSVKLDSLQKVFVAQLKDMYSAEHQLLDVLPRLHEAATSQKLKDAFREHMEETQGQIARIDSIFEPLDFEPGGHRCEAMDGLVKEAKEIINEDGEPEAKDAALICAAQKIEHYEIATYGSLRAYARVLDLDKAYKLLHKTLEEERSADSLLTDLAENTINRLAMLAAN